MLNGERIYSQEAESCSLQIPSTQQTNEAAICLFLVVKCTFAAAFYE
jgi:hypothetical protein